MQHNRIPLFIFAATIAGFLGIGETLSQDYPFKTIKILVPNAPGGLVDILPRVLGQKITEVTKQAVVVENRIGGNGALAGAEVARSTPDGYTLLMSFHALNAMLPHMTKLTFDPNKDLTPIVHVLTVPNVLVVHPSVPANSLKDLVAYGKANPGKLTFASQGVGSTGHLAGALFGQLTGLDIVHVPYRGPSPAAQALMGGQTSMMFDVVTLALEPLKAGKLRALGVASTKRIDILYEVPTLSEVGVPLEMSGWFGLMAPANTPTSIITWLNREANRVFALPEVRENYVGRGASLPLGTPDAFASHIAAEYEKWGGVIRQANIRID
jgi:tripartite-type tricarboxylate transporter receptor subunit TctC